MATCYFHPRSIVDRYIYALLSETYGNRTPKTGAASTHIKNNAYVPTKKVPAQWMEAPPYQPLLASVPPPQPVVVVSPQFCSPDVVTLTVTKKVMSASGGDFTVTDPNGAVVLQVKGSFFSIRNHRVLLDAAGHPILSMHEKVFTMHNRWEVFRGDSTKASDLLFTAKRSTVLQLKTEMDVFLAGNTAQQVCDFKMKGSYFERNCAIYLGSSDTMIAHISRKYTAANVLLGKDTFNLTVFPDVDHVFIAALVVVLDEVHSRDRNY